MSFIGIVSNRKSFERIENLINKDVLTDKKKINIINLNLNSIKNLKNIKFETLIIEDNIDKYSNYSMTIQNLINNTNTLIINTDINKNCKFVDNQSKTIITYGLSKKANVTISSIKDENILVCCQKNIRNINNRLIEIHENRIRIKNVYNKKLYEFLIIYIIGILYN